EACLRQLELGLLVEKRGEKKKSQYHGSTLRFNGNQLNSNDSLAEKDIQDGSNTLTITQNSGDFILNALAINGVTVTVPDDPEYPSGLFDSDTKSSGPVSTGITDMNGEVIATVTVEATASYGGWLLGWYR